MVISLWKYDFFSVGRPLTANHKLWFNYLVVTKDFFHRFCCEQFHAGTFSPTPSLSCNVSHLCQKACFLLWAVTEGYWSSLQLTTLWNSAIHTDTRWLVIGQPGSYSSRLPHITDFCVYTQRCFGVFCGHGLTRGREMTAPHKLVNGISAFSSYLHVLLVDRSKLTLSAWTRFPWVGLKRPKLQWLMFQLATMLTRDVPLQQRLKWDISNIKGNVLCNVLLWKRETSSSCKSHIRIML